MKIWSNPGVEDIKATFERICEHLKDGTYDSGIDAYTMCDTMNGLYKYITNMKPSVTEFSQQKVAKVARREATLNPSPSKQGQRPVDESPVAKHQTLTQTDLPGSAAASVWDKTDPLKLITAPPPKIKPKEASKSTLLPSKKGTETAVPGAKPGLGKKEKKKKAAPKGEAEEAKAVVS